MQSNILAGDNTTKVITRTLDPIMKLLANTLGPNGRGILVEGAMLNHSITKDGHTVLSKLAFEGQLERAILNFLQKISSRINRKVGDGTTTSILVGSNLYKNVLENQEYKGNLTGFLKTLKKVAKELEECILEYSDKPTDDKGITELIKNIAMVSSNYDEEIVNLISKTYAEIGVDAAITTKVSSNKESSVVVSSGFEHLRGMVIPTFANHNEGKEYFAAGNVRVILSERGINASDMQRLSVIVNEICITGKGSLIIMAPSYDEAFLQFLYSNKQSMKDELSICAVDISIKSANAQDIFGDLKAFMIEESPAMIDGFHFARVDEALITRDKTIFKCAMIDVNFGDYGTSPSDLKFLANKDNRLNRIDRINEKIKDLEKIAQQHETKDEEIARLKRRKINLSDAGLATIMVGGETDSERKTRLYLVEDAIYAVQSALRDGTVPGSNIAMFLAIRELNIKYGEDFEESNILKYLNQAYMKVFETLLDNQGVETKNAPLIVDAIIGYIYYDHFDGYGDPDDYYAIPNILNLSSLDIRQLAELSVFNEIVTDKSYVNDKIHSIMDDNCPIKNSVDTDIQILRAVVSIIGLLLDCKGFISTTGFISSQYNEPRC